MDINRLTDPREVEKLVRRLHAAHIGYELVLTDNLDCEPSFNDVNPIGANPVKVVGTSMVLCVDGTVTYRVNLADHTVRSGECLIILPGSIMQIKHVSTDIKMAIISFASEYYEAIVDVGAEMRNSPVVRVSPSDFEECVIIYRRLRDRLFIRSDEVVKSMAKGYMRVVCTIIFDYWRKSGKEASWEGSRPKELYAKFLSQVQSDYRTHHALRHYADVLCVTPKYLSSVVKSVSGRNASEFIDELIVFESKALLADGSHTVQQVAEVMQFPNPSFFAKYFRQHTGISPSTYRKQLQ